MIDENKLLEELNKKAKEFDQECGYFLNKFEFQEAYRCAGKTLGIVAAMEIVKAQEIIEVPFSRTENEWIPVQERLPDEEEFISAYLRKKCVAEFIVMIKGANKPTTLYFTRSGKLVDEELNTYDVIAWQSLPEPYKGE